MENLRKGGNMLHPWYITGITDGEGCFSVSFTKRSKITVGIETRPSFSISLTRRDLELVKQIQSFFKCGAIRFSRSDRVYKFETRSISEIVNKVIPHFEKYPLHGDKKKDFEAFREICNLIYRNLHLNREYLAVIIERAYQMNPSGKRKYSREELLRMLDEVKR